MNVIQNASMETVLICQAVLLVNVPVDITTILPRAPVTMMMSVLVNLVLMVAAETSMVGLNASVKKA